MTSGEGPVCDAGRDEGDHESTSANGVRGGQEQGYDGLQMVDEQVLSRLSMGQGKTFGVDDA